MLYSLSVLGFVLIVLFLLWKLVLPRVIDHLPRQVSSRLRHYAPLSTFEDAMENGERPVAAWLVSTDASTQSETHTGFSTADFDLADNVAGDARAGLDERTLTEIRRIMERECCNFDEARLIHTNKVFRKNGQFPPTQAGTETLPLTRWTVSTGIDPNGFPIGLLTELLHSADSQLTPSHDCRPKGDHLTRMIEVSSSCTSLRLSTPRALMRQDPKCQLLLQL